MCRSYVINTLEPMNMLDPYSLIWQEHNVRKILFFATSAGGDTAESSGSGV